MHLSFGRILVSARRHDAPQPPCPVAAGPATGAALLVPAARCASPEEALAGGLWPRLPWVQDPTMPVHTPKPTEPTDRCPKCGTQGTPQQTIGNMTSYVCPKCGTRWMSTR